MMLRTLFLIVICGFSSICVSAQTSSFTYQGRLTDGGTPANGPYQMQFTLFPSAVGGDPLGPPIQLDSVNVANGVFTVELNFTALSAFNGGPRWLEIAVKKPTDHLFSVLTPRQQITSTPYALRTSVANSADTLSSACTLCVTDAQIQAVDGSKVAGTVANATNASTAVNVTGVVQIANGGTGTSTQNFIDLATDQTVAGKKTFTDIGGNGSRLTTLNGANIANNSIAASALASDTFPNSRNLSLLGSLRWDLLEQRVGVATGPQGLAFDGVNIWVANKGNNSVTKFRASDGFVQGTFAAGPNPMRVAFDGSNIWVTNTNSNTVTKLRSSDGACIGTCTLTVGLDPYGVAFDGTNIWVANNGSNSVTKLRASDGESQGTFAVGSLPQGIAFDGANMWIVNNGSNTVTKLRASDGANLGTFPAGVVPEDLAFDGANVWITSQDNQSVAKLRASDGMNVGTFQCGSSPLGIAFDGANMWIVNNGPGVVTKLRASDGANLGAYPVGTHPIGVAFDGANVWVANSASNNVTKLPVLQ